MNAIPMHHIVLIQSSIALNHPLNPSLELIFNLAYDIEILVIACNTKIN